MAMRTVFLDDQQIRAQKILTTMRIEELKMAGENPELIRIYEKSLTQLGRAQ